MHGSMVMRNVDVFVRTTSYTIELIIDVIIARKFNCT